MTVRVPWVTRWGDDPDSWNVDDADYGEGGDGSGLPGLTLVAAAVSCWLAAPGACRAAVASVFNLPAALAGDLAAVSVAAPADIAQAIQTWSLLQGCRVPVAEAAAVFELPPDVVERLVGAHPWMFVEHAGAERFIGHDGC